MMNFGTLLSNLEERIYLNKKYQYVKYWYFFLNIKLTQLLSFIPPYFGAVFIAT